jgi:hypothetical protein
VDKSDEKGRNILIDENANSKTLRDGKSIEVVLAKRTGLLGNNIKPTRVSVQR